MTELGRGDELGALIAKAQLAKPWDETGRALAAGDFTAAADGCEALGVRTYEAQARLRAAEQLLRDRRSSEAYVQLERSPAFWRSVGATRHIRQGEALRAATA